MVVLILGPIDSSTPDTLTLANNPNWIWIGTSNPQAALLVVAFGTGVGQYSFLKSYSGRTPTLSTPLAVLPDSTSVVGVFQYELNIAIVRNTIKDTLGVSILLADALESATEDNSFINSGGGIIFSAYGPYGSPVGYGPVLNTDALRNRIEVGGGNLISRNAGHYIWGIGIENLPGCLLSGLVG
jgi:hypothetical protein